MQVRFFKTENCWHTGVPRARVARAGNPFLTGGGYALLAESNCGHFEAVRWNLPHVSIHETPLPFCRTTTDCMVAVLNRWRRGGPFVSGRVLTITAWVFFAAGPRKLAARSVESLQSCVPTHARRSPKAKSAFEYPKVYIDSRPKKTDGRKLLQPPFVSVQRTSSQNAKNPIAKTIVDGAARPISVA